MLSFVSWSKDEKTNIVDEYLTFGVPKCMIVVHSVGSIFVMDKEYLTCCPPTVPWLTFNHNTTPNRNIVNMFVIPTNEGMFELGQCSNKLGVQTWPHDPYLWTQDWTQAQSLLSQSGWGVCLCQDHFPTLAPLIFVMIWTHTLVWTQVKSKVSLSTNSSAFLYTFFGLASWM